MQRTVFSQQQQVTNRYTTIHLKRFERCSFDPVKLNHPSTAIGVSCPTNQRNKSLDCKHLVVGKKTANEEEKEIKKGRKRKK
jgi:hypothetical protein